MRTIIIFASILLMTSAVLNAQRKKDLIDEISNLKQELRSTKSDLSEASRKVKGNESQIRSMEVQVKELKETNTSLLTNMSSFTELSSKKASNLQISQEMIREKDRQLNTINDALTKNDSINLAVFSKLKNATGGDNLKIANGTIYILLPNSTLFGSDKNLDVNKDAKAMLGKIAHVLNSNPELGIIVEGNSNALNFDGKAVRDNWDLSSRQAAAVVSVLQNEFEVPPVKMKVLGKGEYGSNAIDTVTRILIDPGFDSFYAMVKNNMKNNKK